LAAGIDAPWIQSFPSCIRVCLAPGVVRLQKIDMESVLYIMKYKKEYNYDCSEKFYCLKEIRN